MAYKKSVNLLKLKRELILKGRQYNKYQKVVATLIRLINEQGERECGIN